MMRRQIFFGLAAIAMVTAAAPLGAHHAFSAEFDAEKPIKLEGTIARTEWINPHAWVHVEVKKADGTKEVWMIEGGTPNTLMRRGITRDSLKVGTQIIVTGFQAKDGSLRANGRDLTYPDGRSLFLGSTGTGAPESDAPKK